MLFIVIFIVLFISIPVLLLLNTEAQIRKVDFYVQSAIIGLMLLFCWTIIIPMLLAVPLGIWQVCSATLFVIRNKSEKNLYHWCYLAAVFTYFMVFYCFMNTNIEFTFFAIAFVLGLVYFGLTMKQYNGETAA